MDQHALAPMQCVAGTLHVVATPIGNLGDLSPRARAILASADLIAAEDTRHSGQLLAHFGIQARLCALHTHNEAQQTPYLIAQLQAGSRLALISDAGTPAISDPGSRLVAAAHAAAVPVVAVAGPSALAAALSVAGFDALPVLFEGFLPARRKARLDRLAALRNQTGTLVFYEAPHRIHDLVADLLAALGPARELVIARELTKRFESVQRLALHAAPQWLAADADRGRGEFVVVVAGAVAAQDDDASLREAQRICGILQESLSLSEAVRLAARISGVRRGALYEWAVGAAKAGQVPLD